MDADDLFPARPGDPLAMLARQDLDRFSVSDLHERIAALEAEIARAKARLDGSLTFRAQADGLFRKG